MSCEFELLRIASSLNSHMHRPADSCDGSSEDASVGLEGGGEAVEPVGAHIAPCVNRESSVALDASPVLKS